MRLGTKTDDEFLTSLNEKNKQIQNIFHEKVKDIAKKYSIDVMMQNGTVKKQETFDVEEIHKIYTMFADKLQGWMSDGISSTNDEGIRRNFIKLKINNSLTIGILGVGYLGSFVGKQLQKNGYNVIGFKNSKPKKKYPFSIFYKKNNLKKFLHQSDVVACILPSTSDTYHMINKNFLQAMKKKVLLINVGRGSTLCEKELIAHLRKNKNFFVSLDVFETEPLTKISPLWKIPNVTITPHIASITLIDSAVEYIYKKYRQYKKNGKIKSDVNFKKGY